MKKFLKVCMDFGNRMNEDNLAAYASSCAFFIFLSLIPVALLLCSLLPYTPLTEDVLLEVLETSLPGIASSIFKSIIKEVYSKSIGITIIAAVAALWSAGKGVNSLTIGLNAIDHQIDKRNMVILRLVSSLYTLGLLVVMLILLVLMIYGKTFVHMLMDYFPRVSGGMEILVNFRTLISMGVITCLFIFCYSLLPVKKMKFRDEIPGAVFTALGWTLFSYLFSIYIDKFDAFSMYGSFATIIVLLVWLYFLMYIVFIGAHLNRYFRPVFLVFRKRMGRDKNKGSDSEESAED